MERHDLVSLIKIVLHYDRRHFAFGGGYRNFNCDAFSLSPAYWITVTFHVSGSGLTCRMLEILRYRGFGKGTDVDQHRNLVKSATVE